jgi:probable phosphoglycerate mutase
VTGERLRRAGICALVSSPLRRAAQTAFEIRDELAGEIQLTFDARLREIELPEWEGLPHVDIPFRFPEQFQNWRFHPCRFSMTSPQSARIFPVRSLYQRVREFWRDLVGAYSGRSIALVTHGGTGRALATTALGLGARYFQNIQQSNCAVSRLCLPPVSQEARLELLNDTSHLDAQLPKLKESKTGTRLLLIPAVGEDAVDLRRIATLLEPVPVDKVFAAGAIGMRTASLTFPSYVAGSIRQVSETSLQQCVHEAVDHRNPHLLIHVAIVASTACLRRLLLQQFGLTAATERVVLADTGITAVHHPGGGDRPVLQTLNMCEPEFGFAGGYV